MKKVCNHCSAEFEITQEDLDFYDQVSPSFKNEKHSIPSPTHCPDCRKQRRLIWANIRNLFWRDCDGTKKKMLSVYPVNAKFPVYNLDYWFGDNWDPLDYGRDFDFSQPFFDQFSDMFYQVPKFSRHSLLSTLENSEYVNYASYLKNCYLVFHTTFAEDCYYSFGIKHCKNVVDSLHCYNSELLYECVYCFDSYRLKYSHNSKNCSDSAFLFHCQSCKNCFACSNLSQKEYYVFNKFVGKDAFEKIMADMKKGSYSLIQQAHKKFFTIKENTIVPESVNLQIEDCSGDNLQNCQNVKSSFNVIDARDCKYIERVYGGIENCYDYDQFGTNAKFIYECECCGVNLNNLLFCLKCRDGSSNLIYCMNCVSCEDCFACDGLQHKKYCILNKQYTKEEYEELIPKIIRHMKQTQEWGEFWPQSLSPFSYDITEANAYFPLLKNEVQEKGWFWEEDQSTETSYMGANVELEDSIHNCNEDICQKILKCKVSGKPYKIIPQEFSFYKKMNIPIPRISPAERQKQRMILRNPRKLWKRNCDKCEKEIETTYAPERPEIVYCEECYLKEIY